MNRLLWVTATALVACATPSSITSTPDTRPSLAISGAPPGSILYLDDRRVGDTAVINDQPRILRTEPGTHDVEVRDPEGRVIFRQRVFVESELKTIVVR